MIWQQVEKACDEGTIYDLEQAALGDMADGLGLIVMHSMIYKDYKKLNMVEYDKFTVNGVITSRRSHCRLSQGNTYL